MEILTTPQDRFDHRVCVDAVNIAIDFHVRDGNCRPIPWRMRALIRQLTIETFCGRKLTEARKIELCDRLKAAVRPWMR